MSKKLIAGICMAVIALSACKKTLPDTPLPVSNQTAYYPAGYNPNLKSKKKSLGYFNGAINDIVIDSTDKRNAFIIGSFNYSGSQSATGICKY
ncbi:MAG: hypothetical protein IT236_10890, partial [Bacteroidia bacterium]|nr:hypothetical protein [Bacteroidia bacterium]